MQTLYAIISILIIALSSVFLFMLFRKGADSGAKKESDKGLFSFKKYVAHDDSTGNDCDIVYGEQECVHDTICSKALYVEVEDLETGAKSQSVVYDTRSLKEKGVVFGRGPKFAYQMTSRYISTDGSFMLQRKDDTFVIRGREDSDSRLKHDGSYRKVIKFTDQVTFYVGELKFTFSVPSYKRKDEPEKPQDIGCGFYSEDEYEESAKTVKVAFD